MVDTTAFKHFLWLVNSFSIPFLGFFSHSYLQNASFSDIFYGYLSGYCIIYFSGPYTSVFIWMLYMLFFWTLCIKVHLDTVYVMFLDIMYRDTGWHYLFECTLSQKCISNCTNYLSWCCMHSLSGLCIYLFSCHWIALIMLLLDRISSFHFGCVKES